MEFARSGDDDSLKEDQKRSDEEHSVGDDDGDTHQKQDTTISEDSPINNTNTEKSVPESGPSTSSAKKEEVDEKLETTKAEMGEVREENQRLKMSLNKIMNEYRVLQMKFHDIVKQETRNSEEKENGDGSHQEIIEEPELVSLSLGRVHRYNIPKNEEKLVKVPKAKLMKVDEEFNNQDLTLGLDCKFETSKSGSTNEALANNNHHQSPANSCEVVAKEEAGETWPPSKALKTVRQSGEDEVSQQNPAKKARVCVRARCDTPTMNDGCQWRKYGQKIAKGNPCPRAYYRCTVAQSCPVRKQVQRCADDMSILITTYEGTHNHPLPLSATAMASTTSAAASMLLSGSTTSVPPSTTPSNNNLHHSLMMNLYDPSKSNQQLYLSNHNLSSSSLPSHPTITLDLTSKPSATNSSSLSSSPFVRFSSNYAQLPKYPSSTSLSFGNNYSSSESNNGIMSWNNNTNGFLNYGTSNRNMNNILSNVNFGRQVQAQQLENFYQSIIMQRNSNNNNNNSVPGLEQHALPETIAAATKAITADPSFQSALAAALSSFIGSTQQQDNHHQGVHGDGENLGLKMKLAELFPVAAAAAATSASSSALNSSKVNNNAIGCGASSFMNKTAPVKAQNGGLMFLPASKSASASPGSDNRDNIN